MAKRLKEQEQEPPKEQEQSSFDAPPAEQKKFPVVAEFNTWRYHRTEPARLFLKGEDIPEGWEDQQPT